MFAQCHRREVGEFDESKGIKRGELKSVARRTCRSMANSESLSANLTEYAE
ncbi:hypothetical protein [Ruminococcus albus]|uniref:hypothetical protein n=1 Tax=Ruminococcus albus TaxID=1264 RepID=UPI001A9A313C|nr:hypothetical protein [Ruminococcus albus]